MLIPVALLGVAALAGAIDRERVEFEELDLALGGYFVGAAIALAGQSGLLWTLVTMHRGRPGGDGNASLVLAGGVLALSAVLLLVPILAFFAFIGALIALVPLAFVVVPCLVAGLAGLLTADGTSALPGWVVACVGTAGWSMAVFGMPVAGGIVVLACATV